MFMYVRSLPWFYHSKEGEELAASVEKLQRQLKITETQSVLCARGLATHSYSDLCCDPQLLIEELYKDAPTLDLCKCY